MRYATWKGGDKKRPVFAGSEEDIADGQGKSQRRFSNNEKELYHYPNPIK